MMLRVKFILLLCFLFYGYALFSNNIRVSTVKWAYKDVIGHKTAIPLTFKVTWDNSWRDDYNWDAAYVFLKYRLKAGGTDQWHPLYIDEATCSPGNLVCEPASGVPNDKGIGLFIYRSSKGNGPVEANVTVTWTLASNSNEPVDWTDFSAVNVQIVASAIEMVYIPRGPFRVGDNFSQKGFWRDYTPFPASVDLLNENSNVFASLGDESAKAAVDHVGESVSDTTSCWIPTGNVEAEWYVDFSAEGKKAVRYFAFCSAKGTAIPDSWYLEATNNMNLAWTKLYSGTSDEWIEAMSTAYPVEHTLAIPEDKLLDPKTGQPKAYTYYRLRIPSFAGTLAIKSISMTDQDIPLIRDHTAIVDGATVKLDRKRHLGASDGTAWTGGVTSSDYRTGYTEYYAMKYELSQEQYVCFLNMLTLVQQTALLPALPSLSEGDYLFGDPKMPSCGNGIVVERKPQAQPVVFACNLDVTDLSNAEGDGQTLACNYLSLKDLLAYASWSGLRPMSELEYEKLGRPLYVYETIPQAGEYAWNTTNLLPTGGVSNRGKASEQANGNANYGGKIGGPLRCGIFAGTHSQSRETSGAGYWGCFELCGNLAEPYYNLNAEGRAFQGLSFTTAHGNGYLTNGSEPIPAAAWPANVAAFALRGGSFASMDETELAISDRRHHQGYFKQLNERDSTVGVRLGRTCPQDESIVVTNILKMENNLMATGDAVAYDTILHGEDYRVTGSKVATTVGEVYSVLWYQSEDADQEWNLMSGNQNDDLEIKKLVGKFASGSKMREYRYKREIIIPGKEEKADVVLRVVDPTYSINSRKQNLIYGTTNHGFTVTSKNAGLVVVWTDLKSGKELPVTASTATTNTYRAKCEDFEDLVFDEERKIEVTTSIHGKVTFKDTVIYVAPIPTHNFDKTTVTIDWNGGAGYTLTTNHLVNVVWRDINSGKQLASATKVTKSTCFPKWRDYQEWPVKSQRQVEVLTTLVDGCYAWCDTLTMITPDCLVGTPFLASVQQFNNYTGGTNTLQVSSTWPVGAPVTWSLEGTTGGITINNSGVLSGLSGTVCNVTVKLIDQRCPQLENRVQVKESIRKFAYTGGVQSVLLSGGNYKLECWGAQGGGYSGSAGGLGGHSYGVANNLQGKRVYVYVGGVGGSTSTSNDGENDGVKCRGGWNGGGNGAGGRGPGGGGMTHMSLVGTDNFVLGTRNVTISVRAYLVTVHHNVSGCTYNGKTHTFYYPISPTSKICTYCNHNGSCISSMTASKTSNVNVNKSVTESYVSTRSFNTSNVLIVAPGGGGGSTYGSTFKAGGLNGQGESGDVIRHSINYPNDEAGGGGGYIGGYVYHGDDPSSSYCGSYYLGTLSSNGAQYGVRSGNGEAWITVQ